MQFLPITFNYEDLESRLALLDTKSFEDSEGTTIVKEVRNPRGKLLFRGSFNRGKRVDQHIFKLEGKKVIFTYNNSGELTTKRVGNLNDPQGFIEFYSNNSLVRKVSMGKVLSL